MKNLKTFRQKLNVAILFITLFGCLSLIKNLEFTFNKEQKKQLFPKICQLPSLYSRSQLYETISERKCYKSNDWGKITKNVWHFNSEIKQMFTLYHYYCEYRSIERYKDDSTYIIGNWSQLVDRMKIIDEVFEVKCTNKDTGFVDYENLFVQLTKRNINKKNKNNDNKCKPLNIMLISYDSVSRTSWLKRLVKTNKFIFEKMKFELLKGYNIMGDGTLAALIPIYTGQTEDELPNVLKNNPNGKYVDEAYPFIWKDLHTNGYISMHLEDWPEKSAFNYRMKGFSNQTCHHYYKHYQLRLEQIKKMKEDKIVQNNDDFCIGAKKRHKVQLDLMTQFKIEYNELAKNLIIMHYVENSHDTNEKFNWIDNELYSFLSQGYNDGLFQNTAIFLYSDHGLRFSDKYTSNDRYLEERLPFFAIYLPEDYKLNNPDKFANLKINKNLLTSPFDIYATVRDLTCLEPINKKLSNLDRSISLLNEISSNRNCEHIGISDHFCTCVQDWHSVKISDKQVNASALFAVSVINQILAPVKKQCQKLKLSEIITAQKLYKDEKLVLVKIQFKTNPNRAIYETLLINSEIDHFEFKSSSFSIRSRNDISRINSYGGQPACVSKFHENSSQILDLRKFCFCTVIVRKRK